jgi:L-threonylcarbamoyladenylate synthase
MERIEVDVWHPEPEVIELAARRLKQGAVLVYPTETFYGLGARAFDSKANRRILELKEREEGKPLPLIASDRDQIEMLTGHVSEDLERLAEAFWPGPLTLVVPARPGLDGPLAHVMTVAVRVSGSVIARELARATASPLTATSANRTRQLPPKTAGEVELALGGEVDLLLDGGPTPGGKPSTIVDLTRGEPRLLREGPVSFENVLGALRGLYGHV